MNKHNNTTFIPENYVFEAGQHKDKKVIWIIFPNNKKLALSLNKTMKAYWSGSNKKWYVADNFQHRSLLGLEPNYYKKSTLLSISSVNQLALTRFVKHLKQKGYS